MTEIEILRAEVAELRALLDHVPEIRAARSREVAAAKMRLLTAIGELPTDAAIAELHKLDRHSQITAVAAMDVHDAAAVAAADPELYAAIAPQLTPWFSQHVAAINTPDAEIERTVTITVSRTVGNQLVSMPKGKAQRLQTAGLGRVEDGGWRSTYYSADRGAHEPPRTYRIPVWADEIMRAHWLEYSAASTIYYEHPIESDRALLAGLERTS